MRRAGASILPFLLGAVLAAGCSAANAEIGAEAEHTVRTAKEDTTAEEEMMLDITIGDMTLTATLADNPSAQALRERLSAAPLKIEMQDYGNMEKVGSLGVELPRKDEQITTQAGDLILYQGNSFVIYYAPNSWNFTRLGKINDMTAEGLKELLGSGSVTVTLSLPQSESAQTGGLSQREYKDLAFAEERNMERVHDFLDKCLQ